MSEIAYWKHTPETQTILKQVREEKNKLEHDLLSGILLSVPSNEQFVNKYTLTLGKIQGLSFIEELLTKDVEMKEND